MNDPQPDRPAPNGVDLDRPSVARIYDYYLGGSANWAIDRVFGDQVLRKVPLVRDMARANRQFLNRAVRLLCRLGVRQFLDIGAGVPTAGNTHQVADQIAPGSCRVVYVDNEAVAIAHAEQLLDAEGDPERHAAIDADLRTPDELWAKAMGTGLLDPEQPIALLLIAVLHIAQPGPNGDTGASAVARYRDLLPQGSYLAISHATTDGVPEKLQESLRQLAEMYSGSGNRGAHRTRTEIEALMGGFELVEPGMTWTPDWHPELQTSLFQPTSEFADPSESIVWAGIGRKP